MSTLRRSSLSASTPAGIPSTRKGAIRAAETTPKAKGELVISSTSQPTATCSIHMPAEDPRVASHKSRNSLLWKVLVRLATWNKKRFRGGYYAGHWPEMQPGNRLASEPPPLTACIVLDRAQGCTFY